MASSPALEPLRHDRPFLGHGVGLRVPHYARALEQGLDVDWVECISENFFGGGGRPRAVLQRLRQDMPLVFHGVSMGVGAASGLNTHYLERLRRLADEFSPAWVSDHLCWNTLEQHHAHDLLPIPYTEEALEVVCRNIDQAQSHLRRPLVLENVSSYVSFNASTMREWEFLTEVVRRTGCKLLLDLNNILVCAKNHGFEPKEFVSGVPAEAIWQLHLANHDDHGHYKFDSHKGAVPHEVWELYRFTLGHCCASQAHVPHGGGRISTLVEWDESVPPWEVLRAEQRKAKAIELATTPQAASTSSAPLHVSA